MILLPCHINERLKDAKLTATLKALPAPHSLRVVLKTYPECAQNLIDCVPFAGAGIVFLSDTEASGPVDAYSARLAALVDKKPGIVLVQVSPSSRRKTTTVYVDGANEKPDGSSRFSRVQRVVVLEYGLSIVPVESVEQAASFISRLIYQESKPAKPKTKVAAATGKLDNQDALMIKSICAIPGIGATKAADVLAQFKS
ncbi:hypothetical protein HDU83_002524 [Entophlyctis luteolus]|nr:hypothetical protein HDU83_002524 [Entophlyctis luteolus]